MIKVVEISKVAHYLYFRSRNVATSNHQGAKMIRVNYHKLSNKYKMNVKGLHPSIYSLKMIKKIAIKRILRSVKFIAKTKLSHAHTNKSKPMTSS